MWIWTVPYPNLQFILCNHFRPRDTCEKLFELFNERTCKFASVDIRADRKVMERTWGFTIPRRYHVDIQDIYHIKGCGRDGRTGMAQLAGELINKSYETMKTKFPKIGHKNWEKQPLDEVNLRYAAVDGFVSFELYRVLQCILKGLVCLQPKPKVPQVIPKLCAPSSSTTSSSKRNKWEEDIYADRPNMGDAWNSGWKWAAWSARYVSYCLYAVLFICSIPELSLAVCACFCVTRSLQCNSYLTNVV